MAWEWSHSPEAYDNARDNLFDKPHDWLVDCLAEIKACITGPCGCYSAYALDLETFEQHKSELADLPGDALAEAIWEFAEKHRTCDNGGFNAHVCPNGCHQVSFDRNKT